MKPVFIGMIHGGPEKPHTIFLASIAHQKRYVERRTRRYAKGRVWAVFEMTEDIEYLHADMRSWFLQIGVPAENIHEVFKTFAASFRRLELRG